MCLYCRVAERETMGEAARKVLKQAAALHCPDFPFPDVTFTEGGKHVEGEGRECAKCCPVCVGSKGDRGKDGNCADGSLLPANGGATAAVRGDADVANRADCNSTDAGADAAEAEAANAAAACVTEVDAGESDAHTSGPAPAACVVRECGAGVAVGGTEQGRDMGDGRTKDAVAAAQRVGNEPEESGPAALLDVASGGCNRLASVRASEPAAAAAASDGGTLHAQGLEAHGSQTQGSEAQGVPAASPEERTHHECGCSPSLCLFLVPPQAQVREARHLLLLLLHSWLLSTGGR